MIAEASAGFRVEKHWSPAARRLGIASAFSILGIGILYVVVIFAWLIVETTPAEPIGDPYLAAMEVLTLASALALLGFVIALWCFSDPEHRAHALAALVFGSLTAGTTTTVHFVQLTAIRQLWRAGELADYRLIWPSVLFAVEYFAWDVLVGLALVFAGLAISKSGHSASASRALLLAGALCLAGASGPLTGWMLLQNVSLVGYALVFPIAAALTGRVFQSTGPFERRTA